MLGRSLVISGRICLLLVCWLRCKLHIASSSLNVSSTSSASLKVKLLWLMSDCRKVGIERLRLWSHDNVFDQLLDVCSVSSGDKCVE